MTDAQVQCPRVEVKVHRDRCLYLLIEFQRSVENTALDTLFRLDNHALRAELGRKTPIAGIFKADGRSTRSNGRRWDGASCDTRPPGGTLGALFAATYPTRCRALILCGAFARFSSWFPTEEALGQFLGYVDHAWGSGGGLPFYVPSRVNDPAFQRWFARFERLGASPAAVASPTIRVPTLVIHRTQDVTVNVEAGRYLAKHIPGARYLELPGSDHPPMIGDNADAIADAIQEFLTGSRAPVAFDRVLATVLFTDIVGSTEKAVALGDRRWRDLLDKHHTTIRSNLTRFRGHEVKTTGDGFLATFDGPARGVRCACAVAEEIKPLGIDVRAGLHTGEFEMMGDDVGGIAVHIGARVASLAGAGEVLVSSTVKDLVAGSGLRFGDRAANPSKVSLRNGAYSQSNGEKLDAPASEGGLARAEDFQVRIASKA